MYKCWFDCLCICVILKKKTVYTLNFEEEEMLRWQFYLLCFKNTAMYLKIGAMKMINFPCVPNGQLIIVGVPKLSHITVIQT